MKRTKRIVALFLMICMCLSMIPAADVKAAEQKDQYPTQVRITPNSIWENYYFTILGEDIDIKNVKSGSKDLVARWTKYESTVDQNNAAISLYTKKEGVYSFSYDVYKNGKKQATKKVKVYAYALPLTVTAEGAKNGVILYAKSGKVKVTCAERGTTIEKIELGTYKDNTWDYEFKPLKNNTKVNYMKLEELKKYNKDENGEYLTHPLNNSMVIRVTVKDKYTKQLQIRDFYFAMWPNK